MLILFKFTRKRPVRASLEKIVPAPDRSIRCFERVEPSYAFDWHYHPECELTLITTGRGQRVVGDHVDEYAPGDFVLVGSNLPHTWASRDETDEIDHRAVCVQFAPDVIGRSFASLPEARPIMNLMNTAEHGLALPLDDFADLASIVRRMPARTPTARMIDLLRVLHDIAGRVDDARPLASAGYRPRLNDRYQKRIDRVLGHLHDRFAEPLAQTELAKIAAMNPAAFSRFFKSATGRTVTDYLNELRIGQACRLLIDTDLSMLDVCYRSGFANVSNFNRRFRERKDMTPSTFRKRYRI